MKYLEELCRICEVPLYIERIQVEEGFLDGLDLELTAGLNVVIGAPVVRARPPLSN